MSKYSKLIKNSGIFFVATFGSKLLTFLLVPYYTHQLSTSEYGIADIVSTTASMLMPIITLSIAEAALRFAMDHAENSGRVFMNSMTVVVIGNTVLLGFFGVVGQIAAIKDYLLLFYGLVWSSSIHLIVSQYCRGAGYVTRFAIGGIISTAVLLVSNIVFLSVLKIDSVTGYILSMILSYTISSIYYLVAIKINKSFFVFDKKLLKEMLLYSIPLIPNAFSWWAMASADRYILLHFAGESMNGIYVAAQKIPSVINIISTIFIQSWQLSAVEEMSSEDKSDFYSKIFSYYSALLLIASSFVTMIIKPLYSVWLAEEYFSAWQYTTILLLANVFSSFSSFVGVNYIAIKKTVGSVATTAVGCIINVVLNLIFIPLYGIYAAAATTLVAFAVTWLLRLKNTRGFVHLKVNYLKLVAVIALISLQYAALFWEVSLGVQAILFLGVLLCHVKDINPLLAMLKERLLRKKKN